MKLQQWEVKTNTNISVFGECEGNTDSKKAIIFSHGFGVKRDSRGLFNELGDMYKDNHLVIRFDYVEVDSKNTIVKPFSTQASMLEACIRYTRQQFHFKNLTLICHSMGCLIPTFVRNLKAEKILLLAPPPGNSYKRMKEYFLKRKGTKFDEKATSTVKRADGTLTFIPKEFWSELMDVNPLKLYKKLHNSFNCFVVKPLQDEVIKDESYEDIKKVFKEKYFECNGTHNFEGEGRKELLTIVKQILYRSHIRGL